MSDVLNIQNLIIQNNNNGDTYEIKKTLTKFGNRTINANWQMILDTFSASTLFKNYPTTNAIDSFVCSDDDFEETVPIEGHYWYNNVLKFRSWNVTAQGQTPVLLPQPLLRSARVSNESKISLATTSDVFQVYESSGATVTNGVVTPESKIAVSFNGDHNQSQQAATSLDSYSYWLLRSLYVSIQKTGSVTAKIRLQIRRIGAIGTAHYVWRTIFNGDVAATAPLDKVWQLPLLVIPPLHDVRVIALGSTSNIELQAELNGFLSKKIA